MNYIENIHPIHQDILLPLAKWKIMSLEDLLVESSFQGTKASFYKIIQKLEENILIDSFIDSWTKEKLIYLLPSGLKCLASHKKSLLINRETRFHDAIVTKVAKHFLTYENFKSISLDHEITNSHIYDKHLPDAILNLEKGSERFSIALEVELVQKSKSRISEIFNFYTSSNEINNVIYIFYKQSTFESYRKHLELTANSKEAKKFLLILEPSIIKRKFNLLDSKSYHNGKMKSLRNILHER